MKGAQGRRCSIASSAFLALLLAGCCFSTPVRARPQNPSEAMMAGSTENMTADQKLPKKVQKHGRQEFWWANPCGVPGGVPLLTSSEEVEILEKDPNQTETWVIQMKNTIQHIKTIESLYKEKYQLSGGDIRAVIKSLRKNLDQEEIQLHFYPEDFKMPWLPVVVQKKYNQAKSLTIKVVSELYTGLQKFAVTIECMMGGKDCKLRQKQRRKMKQYPKKLHHLSKNHQQISENRMAMLKDIKEQLRTLLCEVQTFLRRVKSGEKLPPHIRPHTLLNTSGDLNPQSKTAQKVLDIAIISKYKRFLLDWEEITNDLLKIVKKRKDRNLRPSRRSREEGLGSENPVRSKNRKIKNNKRQRERQSQLSKSDRVQN